MEIYWHSGGTTLLYVMATLGMSLWLCCGLYICLAVGCGLCFMSPYSSWQTENVLVQLGVRAQSIQNAFRSWPHCLSRSHPLSLPPSRHHMFSTVWFSCISHKFMYIINVDFLFLSWPKSWVKKFFLHVIVTKYGYAGNNLIL